MVSEENIFRNRPIRNKNCLWWPCLLTNLNKMRNLYRGPSINASYQVWFIWPSGFREDFFFRNHPIRNKNWLWWPCSLTDRDEMNNLYIQPSIDASYQVSVQLATWFPRRRFIRNQPEPIRNKNCLWWSCVLADRNKICSLYRGPSIDASYQVSVYLA